MSNTEINENDKYRLSVVIPTKDRYKYLIPCVSYMSKSLPNTMEIVVQDNTKNNDEMQSLIEKLDDKRITYNHVPTYLTMSDNSSMAVKISHGKYVYFIGDDDIVLPNVTEVLDYVEEFDLDSCTFQMAKYVWPDVYNYEIGEVYNFQYELHDGKVEEYSCDKALKYVLNHGAIQIYNLPKIYHGLVKREVLDRVYEKTGSYFPGSSPDMASSVCLSLIESKNIHINYIAAISGFSARSAGGKGMKKQHVGKISEKKFLASDTEEKWEKKVPCTWTSEAIFAESAIKALRMMERTEWIKEFNYEYSYAEFLFHHRNQKEMIDVLITSAAQRMKVKYYSLCLILRHVSNYLKRRFRNTTHIYNRFRKIKTIEDAAVFIEKLDQSIGDHV